MRLNFNLSRRYSARTTQEFSLKTSSANEQYTLIHDARQTDITAWSMKAEYFGGNQREMTMILSEYPH